MLALTAVARRFLTEIGPDGPRVGAGGSFAEGAGEGA